MANCPNCGAEINKLYLLDKGNIATFIAPNGDLGYVYEGIGEDEDDDEDIYGCPCCNAIVAHDDDEALQILSGL